MAGGALDEEDEITGINVTPLVDVMLVLLIIFMVTANYVSSSAIDLEMPQAETGESTSVDKAINLMIDGESNIFVDGEKVDELGLVVALKEGKEKLGVENAQALITADVKTPHGEVVRLIDLVRKNGIKDFAINVEIPSADAVAK